jgi:catechol 2,3-dioxygenase-like lactoylglutathione lyase family enzyme
MLRIREIDHLVLRVRDVQAMIRFYGEVLGCPVARIDEKLGLVQLRAGRGLIDLVPLDSELGRRGGAAPGREGRNLDHFCLRVEHWDAGAIAAHLRAHGVEPGPVAQRFGAEGQGPSLYLADPEGNTVELKGPPGGAD